MPSTDAPRSTALPEAARRGDSSAGAARALLAATTAGASLGFFIAAAETAHVLHRWKPHLADWRARLAFIVWPCAIGLALGAALGAALTAIVVASQRARVAEGRPAARALGAVGCVVAAYVLLSLGLHLEAVRIEALPSWAALPVVTLVLGLAIALGARWGSKLVDSRTRLLERWAPRFAAAAVVVTVAGFAAQVPPKRADVAVTSAGPSMLLVTVDTLRADAVGSYGNPEARTPSLDRLAREGARFTHALSLVIATDPSHATILTSTPPSRSGLRRNGERLAPDRTTLAQTLARQGFATFAAVSVEHLNGDVSALNRGFDTYVDRGLFDRFAQHGAARLASTLRPGRALGATGDHERRGDRTVDQLLDWLDDHEAERFFAWIHLFDAHFPYTSPGSPDLKRVRRLAGHIKEVQHGNDPPDPATVRELEGRYAAEVTFADAQIGRVLDDLARRGLLDHTLVVVTSDHGEHFTEPHVGRLEWFDHVEPFEETAHVPLLLRLPGTVRAGGVVEGTASLLDVAPTALGLLGLEPEPAFEGRNLARFVRRPRARLPASAVAIQANPHNYPRTWAVTDGEWKLLSRRASDEDLLFHLPTDPGELVDRKAEQREIAHGLALTLDELLSQSAPRPEQPELSPERRDMLRALGYAE